MWRWGRGRGDEGMKAVCLFIVWMVLGAEIVEKTCYYVFASIWTI